MWTASSLLDLSDPRSSDPWQQRRGSLMLAWRSRLKPCWQAFQFRPITRQLVLHLYDDIRVSEYSSSKFQATLMAWLLSLIRPFLNPSIQRRRHVWHDPPLSVPPPEESCMTVQHACSWRWKRMRLAGHDLYPHGFCEERAGLGGGDAGRHITSDIIS